jgi:hypothetical protein
MGVPAAGPLPKQHLWLFCLLLFPAFLDFTEAAWKMEGHGNRR